MVLLTGPSSKALWHSVIGFLPHLCPSFKGSIIESLVPSLLGPLGKYWKPWEVFLSGGSRVRLEPSRTSYSCALSDSMLSVHCKMNCLGYTLPPPQCSAFLRSDISGDQGIECSETILLLEVLYVGCSAITMETPTSNIGL